MLDDLFEGLGELENYAFLSSLDGTEGDAKKYKLSKTLTGMKGKKNASSTFIAIAKLLESGVTAVSFRGAFPRNTRLPMTDSLALRNAVIAVVRKTEKFLNSKVKRIGYRKTWKKYRAILGRIRNKL